MGNTLFTHLYQELCEGKAKLSLVGLGYVGMPIAVAFSERLKVIGYDLNAQKIELYKRGVDPTNEVGDEKIRACGVDFTAEERSALMKTLTDPFANVSVHQWEGLIVNYAKQSGANILLRGIRNANDFAYEFDLSLMNHNLNGAIETLFIPTEQRYSIVKSSSIKELALFGGDISGMVPPLVADAMKKKYDTLKK